MNWVKREQGGRTIDVSLNDMASEGGACGSGEFKIDDRAGAEMGEGGAGDGLGCEIRREAWGEGAGAR
jgi:hypothetical protein